MKIVHRDVEGLRKTQKRKEMSSETTEVDKKSAVVRTSSSKYLLWRTVLEWSGGVVVKIKQCYVISASGCVIWQHT